MNKRASEKAAGASLLNKNADASLGHLILHYLVLDGFYNTITTIISASFSTII